MSDRPSSNAQPSSEQGHHAPALAAVALGALGARYLPSMVALGQWTPARSLPGGICRWRGPGTRPEVALTFDDGPHPEGTPAVLDRLDELGLRATFFPLASEAERHPGLLAEVVRRGHAVGTHGFRHGHHLVHGRAWVRRDLDAAEATMTRLGHALRWYRPTYGQVTAATLAVARTKGWRPVLWSVWGREWATSDPAAVSARVTRRLSPGDVVLLHDSDRFGPAGMWRTALASLGPIAAAMDRRGVAGVTLDELVG